MLDYTEDEDAAEGEIDEGAWVGLGHARAVLDVEQMWLQSAVRYRLLTADEELLAAAGARICACCADGRQALVNHNLRLIPPIAKRWKLAHGVSLELTDLWQYGVPGLMKAAVRFDPRRHLKFSTVATWWIRHDISRSVVNEGYLVREPVYLHDGRTRPVVSDDEFSHRIIPDSLNKTIEPKSHGSVAGEETVEAHIADENAVDPLEAATESDARRQLYAVMRQHLSERERLVLALRYGMVEDRVWTLEECGAPLGLSRERIRQIEDIALDKLRAALGASRAGVPTYTETAYFQSRPRMLHSPTPAPHEPQKRRRPAPTVSQPTTANETREPSPTDKQQMIVTTPARRRAPSRKPGDCSAAAPDASSSIPTPSNSSAEQAVPSSSKGNTMVARVSTSPRGKRHSTHAKQKAV